jgi:UDP-3-O-[3-hydroxymyristoyl] N-acetylglucosamine deacetylase
VTVCHPVSVRGVGLHTGAASSIRLRPAEQPGEGIIFRAGEVSIPALAANVTDTSRCTVLGAPGASVSTIEHLLSACAGLGVADLLVEVDGPELPIGDGSAALWVDALREAGVTDNDGSAVELTEPVMLTGKDGQFIAAYPADTLTVTVAISFPHPLVGTQVARFAPSRGDDYARDIAPARTFGFIEEVEALQKAGLALGGSLENAVVVYPDRYSVPLRFPDELARHKLLDVLGDLALGGFPNLPRADIIAVKPSHRLNVAFAARLVDACRRTSRTMA